jgi:hypothetical protein
MDTFQNDLNLLTQYYWFRDTAPSYWRDQYYVPYAYIFTKWGFCFTFNLMPQEKLLNLEE